MGFGCPPKWGGLRISHIHRFGPIVIFKPFKRSLTQGELGNFFMPQVKDATVFISGQIIALDLTSDYETKAPTGAKATVLAGDGMAIVKLKLDALQLVKPLPGDSVVWVVRPAPYSMEGNSGMSVAFVRLMDMGDLDGIHTKLSAVVNA